MHWLNKSGLVNSIGVGNLNGDLDENMQPND